MKHSPSLEGNSYLGSQEIFRTLWNPEVHYRNEKKKALLSSLLAVTELNKLLLILKLSLHLYINHALLLVRSFGSFSGQGLPSLQPQTFSVP
jgi:hypothetical protein